VLREREYGYWAVEVTDADPFVGFVGLGDPSFDAHFTPAVEIGWRLATAHWGKGYATEAARACLDYGFGPLDLGEIVAFTAVGNHDSRRVMDRLGMTHDKNDDFDHPRVSPRSPHRRDVLYRITRESHAGR
jgi:RimJ/RimL family protein N-acetyltransferase